MKRSELNQFVGKQVEIKFTDGEVETGKLEYVNEFSYKSGHRKPGYFYIGLLGFKVSHVKSCKEV